MTEPAARPRPISLAVVENVTLWSVVAAVSLFTVGQLSHFYEYGSYGLRGLRVEVPWQDRVFEGGVAILNNVLNTLFAPRLSHLPWMIAVALFAFALWRWSNSQARPKARVLLALLAGGAYLAVLILIGIDWGRSLAEMRRSETEVHDRFVFAPDAVARLPAPLLQDNEQRKLKLIVATPEFVVMLSADGKTTWRIATRDVELQETTR